MKNQKTGLEGTIEQSVKVAERLGAALLNALKYHPHSDEVNEAFAEYTDLSEQLGRVARRAKIIEEAVNRQPQAKFLVQSLIKDQACAAFRHEQDATAIASALDAPIPGCSENTTARKEARKLACEVIKWQYMKWQDYRVCLQPFEDAILESRVTVATDEISRFRKEGFRPPIASVEMRLAMATELKNEVHACYGDECELFKLTCEIVKYWHREAKGLTRDAVGVSEQLIENAHQIHADMLMAQRAEAAVSEAQDALSGKVGSDPA